ncbi:MAG: TolC family protein [Pyrinomonadaceae bacterium]
MFSSRLRTTLQTATLWLTACAVTFAQTPAPPPQQQTPAQREATRPPGTQQQRQPVTREGRPVTVDTDAPPGTQRRAPQTPPSTNPATSPSPLDPILLPSPQQTPADPADPAAAPTADVQEVRDPEFVTEKPRPVPPLPSLTRLGVTSGNSVPLTLNEAIRRALANNNDIEIARNDVRFAETQILAIRGAYDPVITFTPEVNYSVRPVVNIFGGAGQAGTVSTTDINNNFSVNKQFGKGGGNFTYFFNNTRETTSSNATSLNPFYSSSQGLNFTQPLFRDRSIDFNRRQLRIQRKRLEQSDADFRRSTVEVIARVQRAYWDLVFALRDQENQIANVNLARENFRRTEASVAAGRSAPLERAEIQTELSNRESALLIASQQVTVAENNLKELILRDPIAPEWTASLVPTDQPTFDETPVNLTEVLTEARANRPELRRLRLQEEINDIDIKYFKNQTKPRIDVGGTVSTTGLAGTTIAPAGVTGPVPLIGGAEVADTIATAFLLQQINVIRQTSALNLGPITSPTITPVSSTLPSNLIGGYGQTLRNLFSFDTRNVVVGVSIQLPLRNRTAEANLTGARIQKDQLAAQQRLQDQSVEVEVRNAAQSVETSRQRVLTAREARRNAELQLAGERRLFQVGRSTTFLLFQRENQLVNARNSELRAETDYNKALADLQRATSTTLRANNVIVDNPLAP